MPDLYSTTVTLLFADVEGSTLLLQRVPDQYPRILAETQSLLQQVFKQYSGRIIDTQGDSFFVAFPRAQDAVGAAVHAQRGLAAHQWGDGTTVRVRMGLHTGEPAVVGDRYVGLDVHRAARIGAAGFGGQVLLSFCVYDMTCGHPSSGILDAEGGCTVCSWLRATGNQVARSQLRDAVLIVTP